MKKAVIYTSMVGEYDKILQPLVLDERFDYILFSDTIGEERIGVWQVRPIPYDDANNMRKSRYAKCLPTKVLSEYEASLYIDANVQIATPYIYKRLFELIGSEVEWAGIKHPDRHCIYEEICAILSLQWVHDYEVVEWYAKLKKAGFPEQWGLYENNVIYRRHTKKIEEVGDMWWQTLENGCRRDQFSLMYCLWKIQPQMTFLLPEDECPRTNSVNFNYYAHNPHKRAVKIRFIEKLRNKCVRVLSSDIREGYHKLFDRLSMCSRPHTMLNLWGAYAIVAYLPKLIKR